VTGFDEYERKARLFPGLLAGLPVVLLVVALGWDQFPAVSVAAGLATGAGASYLLANLVRYRGRAVEPGLWQSWGGAPTVRFLRTREKADNPRQRESWREAVEAATGVSLVSAEEELADPDRADQEIEVAIRRLLPLGHGGTDYNLLHAENTAYGFERNLWALRWVGRLLSGLCLVALVGAALLAETRAHANPMPLWAGAGLELICLIAWGAAPSSARVRDSAERYATQLLDAAQAEAHRKGGTT
jgi:hypothetical protein